MGITATRLDELGLIDGIIKEPLGGAHRDYDVIATSIAESLEKKLNVLCQKNTATLVSERQNRIRQYGNFNV
jgi:acetyl-CoA carboxylase carboxyl transferase subunit alpha